MVEAVARGHREVVAALLQHGAATTEPQGAQAPLRLAVELGHDAIVDDLLAAGARPLVYDIVHLVASPGTTRAGHHHPPTCRRRHRRSRSPPRATDDARGSDRPSRRGHADPLCRRRALPERVVGIRALRVIGVRDAPCSFPGRIHDPAGSRYLHRLAARRTRRPGNATDRLRGGATRRSADNFR